MPARQVAWAMVLLDERGRVRLRRTTWGPAAHGVRTATMTNRRCLGAGKVRGQRTPKRLMQPKPVLLFSFLLMIACGSTDRNDMPGNLGGSGGDGGASNAAQAGNAVGGLADDVGCSSPNAFPLWGKPYDVANDCIEVDRPLENVACQINPTEDDPNQFVGVGFACLERLPDGAQYWVYSLHSLGFDAEAWKLCADAPPIAPKGCYAAGCPYAPRSSCSLEDTRQQYQCSATGEFDENCCGRQPCSKSSDCQAGEECQSVNSSGQWYCWDYPGGCDCGGPMGGPPRRLCMPQ